MKINRYNYEEFFLLYIDNELDITDKKLVEEFIHENTDLQTEFLQLQQTVIPSDKIIFKNKETLTKQSLTPDFQEQIFLYLDNELPIEKKLEFESFLNSTPSFNAEFEKFKQIILPLETIKFENKELLYKEEESKVVPFPWLQFSAAAIFIGLIATTWIFKDDLFLTSVPIKTVLTKPAINNQFYNKISESPNTVASINNNKELLKKAIVLTISKSNTAVKTIVEVPRKEIDFELAQLNRVVPTINSNESINNKLINKLEPQELKNSITASDEAEINAAKIVTPAVYKELDTSDEEKNSILIGSTEFNKKKLKNILKSVTNLFGKPNQDDGKIKVAAFEIKTN